MLSNSGDIQISRKKSPHAKVVVFTGGGTGGHVLPIVSLIEYAQKNTEIWRNCKAVLWLGEEHGMEAEHAAQLKHIEFFPVMSGKMRRYRNIVSTLQNIRDFFKVIIGFFQALWHLKINKVDVVFCKGGYVALPVCYAAKLYGIKVVLHESDMKAGLTNRLVSRIATTTFTGFPGVFKGGIEVGQILSGRLLDSKYIEFNGLDMTKTIVMVIGGAQGANDIFKLLPNLTATYTGVFQFIVLTGTKNQKWSEKLQHIDGIWTCGFVSQEELSYIMSISDLSISRGSMTSLSEQQMFGIKKVIIPLPFTGGNHQEYNARYFVNKYGDIFIPQNSQTLQNIEKVLIPFKGYKKKQQGIDDSSLFSAHKQVRESLIQ